MVKVSVIVPVYNVEKYLNECLDCLIGQTLKDIEIIAVNDGSEDNSLRILEEYAAKDKRIKIINQENAGQSAARNKGLKLAKGEYVAFIDSDDKVDLDFCEKLYVAATAAAADIASGVIVSCSKDGQCQKKCLGRDIGTLYNLKEKWHYLLDDGAHCYICNKIYRRKILIDKGLFFAEGRVYEDILWSPQVVKQSDKAVIVPDAFYYYRFNPSSTTRNVGINEKYIQDYKEARVSLVRFAGYYKLNVSFDALQRSVYKIFGVPVVKIEYGDTGFRFFLFGICCIKKEIRRRM